MKKTTYIILFNTSNKPNAEATRDDTGAIVTCDEQRARQRIAELGDKVLRAYNAQTGEAL